MTFIGGGENARSSDRRRHRSNPLSPAHHPAGERSMRTRNVIAVLFGTLLIHTAAAQTPVSTVFTYQGEVRNGGVPASGLHDLRFRLYDAGAGGSQVGTTLCFDNVNVQGGKFTVGLNFGAQFPGTARFL